MHIDASTRVSVKTAYSTETAVTATLVDALSEKSDVLTEAGCCNGSLVFSDGAFWQKYNSVVSVRTFLIENRYKGSKYRPDATFWSAIQASLYGL